QHRRVRSSSPGRRDTVQINRDLVLRELLGFNLQGDIIDPNLLEFSAGFEFGMGQSRFDEELGSFDQSDSSNGLLLNYDLTVDLFKSKPVSIHAYARRSSERIARRFLPSLRERQDEAGVSMLAVTGDVTTEMGLTWSQLEREGNRADLDDERQENLRFYVDSDWDIAEGHKLRLQFDHERLNNTFQGSSFDFDTTRTELRLDHELAFGDLQQHSLNSFLRFNNERGDLPRDEFEAATRLALKHNDQFRTIWRYGYYKFQQSALDVDQHKFDGTVVYTPNDDWRFTVDGFILQEFASDDVDVDEYGWLLDVSYRKKNRLGELNVNASLGWTRTRTRGNGGRRFVRNEAHRLNTVRPVNLRETGVVLGTLFAHNAARTRQYVAGTDYRIAYTGGRVQIFHIPSGRIDEDEVVYFDYDYEVPTEAKVDSVRTDFLIEHRFEFGLTPYYRFEGRFENADNEGRVVLLRDNMDRHRLGVRFDRQHWSLSAELEVFDDTVEPYDAIHFTGRAALLRTPAHNTEISGELSRYWFEGGLDDRRVWWLDLRLADRWQLNPYMSLTSGASYRLEDDTVGGHTNALDVDVVLAYTRNYLTVELAAEYNLLSFADPRDEGYGFYVNIRRDLSHLIPKNLRVSR
ncbi:MAG: hypothetical protein ACE5GE_07620, partial [Phycisphaerae bacterium]